MPATNIPSPSLLGGNPNGPTPVARPTGPSTLPYEDLFNVRDNPNMLTSPSSIALNRARRADWETYFGKDFTTGLPKWDETLILQAEQYQRQGVAPQAAYERTLNSWDSISHAVLDPKIELAEANSGFNSIFGKLIAAGFSAIPGIGPAAGAFLGATFGHGEGVLGSLLGAASGAIGASGLSNIHKMLAGTAVSTAGNIVTQLFGSQPGASILGGILGSQSGSPSPSATTLGGGFNLPNISQRGVTEMGYGGATRKNAASSSGRATAAPRLLGS